MHFHLVYTKLIQMVNLIIPPTPLGVKIIYPVNVYSFFNQDRPSQRLIDVMLTHLQFLWFEVTGVM